MDQDHPDAREHPCEQQDKKPDSHPFGQRRKRFRNHLILFRESLGVDPALTNVAVFVTFLTRGGSTRTLRAYPEHIVEGYA